jgi:hypothetical protein
MYAHVHDTHVCAYMSWDIAETQPIEVLNSLDGSIILLFSCFFLLNLWKIMPLSIGSLVDVVLLSVILEW